MQERGRRRNFWPIGGLLLAVISFLSYFFLFARFPATRDFPWVNLILFAAALAIAAAGIVRAYRRPAYRGKVLGPLLGGCTALIAGLFVVYTFWFSRQIPPSKGAPSVGRAAPDFTLPDTNGHPVTLSKLLSAGDARWVVLIFYRGYW